MTPKSTHFSEKSIVIVVSFPTHADSCAQLPDSAMSKDLTIMRSDHPVVSER